MSKIAVIGSENLIGGFKSLGTVVLPAETVEEARQHLEEAGKKKDFSIIFIIEDLAAGVTDLIDKINRKILPSIVIIPGIKTGFDLGRRRIKKLVERAIGKDIN